MVIATKSCVVCREPLTFQQALRGPVCDRPACRWEALAAQGRSCSVCGRPLAPGRPEPVPGVCASPSCGAAHSAGRRGELERLRRADLERRTLALRAARAEAAGVAEPAGFPAVVVPAFRSPVGNLAERRRRALRDHVDLQIRLAVERAPAPANGPTVQAPLAAPDSPVHGLLGAACGLCRGSCCRGGGEHAYITPATIGRVLEAQPGLRPRDVLAAYLAHVPRRTVRGSCLFHGPEGCALPRELRSDTCNRYYCEDLRAFRGPATAPEPPRAFFAAAEGDAIVAAAFVAAEAVRPVDPPVVE